MTLISKDNNVYIKKKKGSQTKILIYDPDYSDTGIIITINKKDRSFYISAWYDSFIEIEGAKVELDPFVELFETR